MRQGSPLGQTGVMTGFLTNVDCLELHLSTVVVAVLLVYPRFWTRFGHDQQSCGLTTGRAKSPAGTPAYRSQSRAHVLKTVAHNPSALTRIEPPSLTRSGPPRECDAEALLMLDQTPISKAIGYARNQRVALRRFLNDGR